MTARSGWSAALRPLARRRSVILGYHGVDTVESGDDPENHCLDPDRFRRQLDALLGAGFQPVTVPELAKQAGGGRPPPGLVAISFDDGMENNRRVALPILHAAGVPATVYVVTGLIGRTNPWMGPASGSRMMSEDELRDLAAAGIELGAHTVSHPDLALLSEDDCHAEIAGSREALEAVIGAPVTSFAYPYCTYGDAALRALARSGLTSAVTCEGRGDWTPYEMPRAVITARDGMPSFVAKLLDLYQPAFDSRPGRLVRSATRGARRRARSAADRHRA